MRPPTIRPFRSAHTRALLVGFLLVPIGAQSTADGAVVGPDVVVSVAPDGPVERGAIATFRIAVRNVGTGRTTSPPVVEIDAQTPEQPTTADGDSWSCTGVAGAPTRCTYARTLGAGESASILQVRRRDARRSDAGVGHVSVAAKVVAGDDGPVYVGGSTAQSPRVSSSLVDLGMTVSATPAGRTGPRRFRVRVRNGDGAATTAPSPSSSRGARTLRRWRPRVRDGDVTMPGRPARTTGSSPPGRARRRSTSPSRWRHPCWTRHGTA